MSEQIATSAASTTGRPAGSSTGPGGAPAAEPSHAAGPAAAAQAEVSSYESARDELAAVVEKLESGGLSLDESLTLWERGEYLASVCSRFLDGARERVDTALARADRSH